MEGIRKHGWKEGEEKEEGKEVKKKEDVREK